VRGPKYVVRKGKTPVLTAEEARELLDSNPIIRNTGRRETAEAGPTDSRKLSSCYSWACAIARSSP
jgi:hypothetical protein